MLNFGPFRPDAASPNSGYATNALNAVPKLSGGKLGYGPFPDLVQAIGAEALPGNPRGNISLVTFDGTWEVYFATDTTIEQMDSSFQFTSIATGLNITAGDDMSFAHFGAYLLNTNTTDGMHAYNVESGGTNDVVTQAPSARFVFTASNVVVALDCDGNNRRLQTSALGDHTDWTGGGADGKTFESGGALICGVDVQNGAAIIFQDNAIRMMRFGAAPGGALYTISLVADGLGVVSARSVISFNGKVYFMTSRGPYDLVPGGQPRPIGSEKINNWFLARCSTENMLRVQAWVDPQSNVVGWSYRAEGVSSTVVFEDSICFDLVLEEWFPIDVAAASISRVATAGYTVDGPYAAILVDDNPTPVDDRLYQGGQPVLAALDSELKYATFSGTPREAVLETCELTKFNHERVTGAKAIVDTASALVRLGAKQRMQNVLTWGDEVSIDVDGFAPVDEAGEVYAMRLRIPSGTLWTNAEGFDAVEGTGTQGPR